MNVGVEAAGNRLDLHYCSPSGLFASFTAVLCISSMHELGMNSVLGNTVFVMHDGNTSLEH